MAVPAGRATLVVLFGCLCAWLPGCDEGEAERGPDRDGPLVVYSSAPQRGPDADVGRAFVAGARAALAQADGRAGGFEVRYVPLESADSEDGSRPEIAHANAERAAEDPAAIAYIGELDPATAAVSLPVLNEAGIAQVGAASLPGGLTRELAGAGAGEPERHYPTGIRHFVRIVPAEERFSSTLAALVRAGGCRRAVVAVRSGGGARARLRQMAVALEAERVTVAGQEEVPPSAERPAGAALAEAIDAVAGDCLVPLRMSSEHLRALVSARGSAPASFGDEWLVRPGSRGSGDAAGDALSLTGAAQSPASFRGEWAALARLLEERRGLPVGPWALYGYEAMSLVLDAVERARGRGDERAAIIEALFATGPRTSVLGTYSIDRFGDTTAARAGVWRAGTRPPRFDRSVEVAPPVG